MQYIFWIFKILLNELFYFCSHLSQTWNRKRKRYFSRVVESIVLKSYSIKSINYLHLKTMKAGSKYDYPENIALDMINLEDCVKKSLSLHNVLIIQK